MIQYFTAGLKRLYYRLNETKATNHDSQPKCLLVPTCALSYRPQISIVASYKPKL